MTDARLVLTLDAGNTRTKWGVFDDAGILVTHGVLANADLRQSLLDPPQAWKECRHAVVSNVAGHEIQQILSAALGFAGITVEFIASTASACEVSNGYEPPGALGTDRWAALIAAWSLYNQPCIVVNAGTALTVDALASHPSGHAIFLGGLITPGLWLMQDTLVNNTAGISDHDGNVQDFPTRTANAVYNGALNAMAGAVRSMLTKLQAHQPGPLHCIIAGGDAAAMAQVLRADMGDGVSIAVVEHLVLQGLYIMAKNSMQKGGIA